MCNSYVVGIFPWPHSYFFGKNYTWLLNKLWLCGKYPLGVLQVSNDGMVQRIFCRFEIHDVGIFGSDKFGKYFVLSIKDTCMKFMYMNIRCFKSDCFIIKQMDGIALHLFLKPVSVTDKVCQNIPAAVFVQHFSFGFGCLGLFVCRNNYQILESLLQVV